MSIHYDRMVESILGSLNVGCPIFTADGEKIGTLAEVRSQHLKVHARMRRDYWIDASNARVSDGKRIELTFNHDDLGAHQADDPGHPKLQSETLGGPRLPSGLVPAGQFSSATSPPEADRSDRGNADQLGPQTDPIVEQTNDLVVSESQQMETRMRMLGGLVEQSSKLEHASPIGEGMPLDASGTLAEPVESELARLEQEHAPVDRQTFGLRPQPSPSRSSPWLLLVGVAAGLGALAAGIMLRRRKHAPGKAQQIIETAHDLPRAAGAGVKAVRTVLNDARVAVDSYHVV
jgi:hypothetical protein